MDSIHPIVGVDMPTKRFFSKGEMIIPMAQRVSGSQILLKNTNDRWKGTSLLGAHSFLLLGRFFLPIVSRVCNSL